MVAPDVAVVGAAMMGLQPPEDYPGKSLIGTVPRPMTAREQWEQRMEAGKERRERANTRA